VETRAAEPTLVPTGVRADHVEGAPLALVVDDDADTRLLVATLLGSHGWEVEEAPDGATALIHVGMHRDLSLVVLDLGLPDIDGMDVLRALRRSIETARIPVVVLTGKTDRETEQRVLAAGADDYIRKPVDGPILLMRSKAVVRRARIA
jgi:two-component system KDP operon response regulator KdpE